MTRELRVELLVLVVALPAVATISWQLGLRLAGAALWLLWPAVLGVWYRNSRALRPPPTAAQPALPRPQQQPVVDPARALLDALGDDVVGGGR